MDPRIHEDEERKGILVILIDLYALLLKGCGMIDKIYGNQFLLGFYD